VIVHRLGHVVNRWLVTNNGVHRLLQMSLAGNGHERVSQPVKAWTVFASQLAELVTDVGSVKRPTTARQEDVICVLGILWRLTSGPDLLNCLQSLRPQRAPTVNPSLWSPLGWPNYL
jgi:hypothetical protein